MDPYAFDWRDDSLKGRPWEEAALYELHVGTFGPDGTFGGVKGRVGYLATYRNVLTGETGAIGVRGSEALLPASDLLRGFPWPC